MSQTHDKFKFFMTSGSSSPIKIEQEGNLTFKSTWVSLSDTDLKALFTQIEEWVKANKVAPKSIGIALLSGKIIISLGFRDDDSYEISLTEIDATVTVEHCLEKDLIFSDPFTNDSNLKNVICHELFVIKNEIHMIFMSKK